MSETIILNVEDHAPTRYARSRLLTAAGYRVVEAKNGAEAMDSLQQHRPDLVLMDVHLPDDNGINICRRMKGTEGDFSVMVVQISATALNASVATQSLDAGADAYLTEPVDPEVLVATVRAMLRLHEAERSLTHAKGQLEIANRELRRSNEDLQQFAFAASHDLQEPLRTITTLTEIIQTELKGSLTDKQREYFGQVVKGAGRMRVLIRDLLTYSQVGRENRLPEAIELKRVVSWARANLQEQIQTAAATIDVTEPLPVVWGDFAHLGLVFQNLFSNSLKYRKPDVPPSIRVAAERASPSEWMISVNDNGEGIAPDYHEQIFAPFKRLHGQELPGSGIGLALCRRILQSHGGKIWVESAVGNGATFKLILQAD